jgi:asparagine synthase (glutamine-hydrolysing)
LCGIAGFTHLGRKTDPSRIRVATESLIHRGPDQQGVYETETVSLGAVRLRIIDLEHGRQPMHSDDGDITLVFNGEIYNHAELRSELESCGHRFDSRCDTEVVLRGFQEWDTRCFEKLRGMFAFALWTQSRRRLVLVRDRLGIKPLYIHQRGRDIYFGSELKALLVHPEIDRNISLEGLDHYLSLNYVPGPYTLIDGIRKLRPGTFLEWRDGTVQAEPYWTLQFRPDDSISFEDAKVELDRLLRESVREHLVSDVPLGIWASGGVDSSAVLHYASEQSSSRLKTFSVSFRGRSFDESRYFRPLAERYQTDHHEFDLSPSESLADAVQDIAYYSDEPGADAGALPVWFLSRMSRAQVTVALSGEGADEVFGGYTTYLADRYARVLRSLPRGARRLALRLAGLLPVSDEKIGLEYKIKRLLAGSLLPDMEAHLYWNGTFSLDEKRSLLSPSIRAEVAAALEFPAAKAFGIGYLNRFLWLDQCCYLPDDILYKCDRMSMAHSLEVRPPFLDHRIVEFAARLPESFKIRGGTLKFLLKELMRDKLPASILNRPKEGFDIPAHHWLRTTLKPLLMDNLNRNTVQRTGLFDWPEVESLIGSHMERRANLGYHLWGLLVLFLWIQRWKVQVPSRVGEKPELLITESVTS